MMRQKFTRLMELMILQVDVGQNGRPLMGPQMEMSSLVLTIQLLRYLILTHTQMSEKSGAVRAVR
jgi:hypothetical protein